MYTHYARLDNNDLDDNGRKRVVQVWRLGQPGMTYDSEVDVELSTTATSRQAHPWMYTDNQEQFDKYAWDGSKIVKYETRLSDYKLAKNQQIDVKTEELISQGFTFDGETFSLSQNAQINWVAIQTTGLLSWPVEITTKDDKAYSLAQLDKDSFVGAGLAAKQSHLDSGRALKVQVNACSTKAEVDAIQDNR